jgi:hypothetical protein
MALDFSLVGQQGQQNVPGTVMRDAQKHRVAQLLAQAQLRQAAQTLMSGEFDLAEKKRGLSELGAKREALQAFIQRGAAQDIPQGIRNPSLVPQGKPAEQGVGPVEKPDFGPQNDRMLYQDLASRGIPEQAEAYRKDLKTEHQGDEDRDLKHRYDASQEARNDDDQLIQRQQLSDTQAQQKIANALAWHTANTARIAATAKTDAAAKGKILPSQRVVDLADQQSGIDMLDKLMKNVPKGLSPYNAWFRTRNPLDTDAQAFVQYVAATKQIIGKALEGGVLRLEDEKKYDKILPKPGDTQDVLNKKALQLRDLLLSKKNNELSDLGNAGYNLGDIQPAQAWPTFNSVEEADAAGVPPGTIVIIDGEPTEMD